ncbi:MAG: hypothetical protein IJG86_00300 [Clostridia bacterium]|nr:hypothetical protein [Clostridia bacterium]
MTTTELIELLKKYERGGATGRPREVMFEVGNRIINTDGIEVTGFGDGLLSELYISLPSAQPTLCGYNIERLELIASVLQKENLPPERVAEVLTDIGRIVAMVKDDVEEALRQALNNFPPAQPERPRGEWIMTKEFDEDVATCPFCGAEMRRKSTGEKPEPPNFCSKCGADLRGKQQ